MSKPPHLRLVTGSGTCPEPELAPTNNFVFGVACPFCHNLHLLSALGVRPVEQEVGVPGMSPTLTSTNQVNSHTGEVIYTDCDEDGVHAVCSYCDGVFALDVVATKVQNGGRRRLRPV